jgi:hypothetical protein
MSFLTGYLTMPAYLESDLDNAVNVVKTGTSVKRAVSDWGVPRSTLQKRLKGAITLKEHALSVRKLSDVQEVHLLNWVLAQESIGLPITHAQVLWFANRCCQLNWLVEPLGKHWLERFLARHPVIKTKNKRSMDSRRINNACTEVIQPWFRYVESPVVKAIKPCNRYNMDETGIMAGFGANGLVLGSSTSLVF